jgi:hypothetical protein
LYNHKEVGSALLLIQPGIHTPDYEWLKYAVLTTIQEFSSQLAKKMLSAKAEEEENESISK